MERTARRGGAGERYRRYVRDVQAGVSTNPVASALAAVLATASLYALLLWLGRDTAGLFHRYLVGDLGIPFIQLLITLLFFGSAFVLLFKWRNISFQEQGFDYAGALLPQPAGEGDDRPHIDVQHAVEFLKDAAQSPYLLVMRLSAGLQRLRNTGSSSGVDDVMRSIAEVDREMSLTSYTFLRFSATIIPVLGFLGTVFGISLAIIEFTVALEGARSFGAIRPDLLDAVANLGLAFNTTLLALFLSGLVLAGMTFVQKREEDLLTAMERFCIDHLVVNLRPPSMSESLEHAIRESAMQTRTAIEVQTAHLRESSASVEGSLKQMAADLRSETQSVGRSLGTDLNELRSEFSMLRAVVDRDGAGDMSGLVSQVERLADSFSDVPELIRATRTLDENLGRLSAELPEFTQALHDAKRVLSTLEPTLEHLAPRVRDLLLPLFKIAILGHRIKSHEISDMREADAILSRLLEEGTDDG